MKEQYVIGLDYGTLSARAVVVSMSDGRVAGQEVVAYPHGVIAGSLPDGTPVPDSYALAAAQDYRDALISGIRGAVARAGVSPEEIAAIGIDATTYTMIPCLRNGTVLSELPEYASEPMAYIKLWKHQGAAAQAKRLETLYREKGCFPVLSRYGGAVNCEFAVPKLLETWEKAPGVFQKAEIICDLGEWLALLLTGKPVHSVFSAGFKAMWHEEYGWPEKEELDTLSPGFGEGLYSKLDGPLSTFDTPCGFLSDTAAELLGLKAGIPVSTPMGDGSTPGLYFCINEPDAVAITVGTSVAVAFASDEKHEISGINGMTFGGIVPKRWSYDAGTPCAGDMLEWFCTHMVNRAAEEAAEKAGKSIHAYLSDLARRDAWKNGLTVMDWWNGNRCILNDMSLRGCVLGMGLSTTTEDLYCAFIQSIACSLRTILEHLSGNGIRVGKVILCGGISAKNPFVTEQLSSVLGREVFVSRESQVTAVSSAMLGAMAAGAEAYEAARKMARTGLTRILPDTAHRAEYEEIYRRWKHYHDLLGTEAR